MNPTEMLIKTYSPTHRHLTINFDQSMTEFEVHAFIYSELKRHGVQVRGNISSPFGGGKVCRFDIVIFDNKKPTRIVEVKSGTNSQPCGMRGEGRQCFRYRQFGIPLIYVIGMDAAKLFVDSYLRERGISRRLS